MIKRLLNSMNIGISNQERDRMCVCSGRVNSMASIMHYSEFTPGWPLFEMSGLPVVVNTANTSILCLSKYGLGCYTHRFYQ